MGKFTVSLLPDCLASRLPSTLPEVEAAVCAVEEHVGSLVELAAKLRPATGPDDDHVAGALRWLRRRRKQVVAILVTVASVMPERFRGHPPTLAGFRAALGVSEVLVALREAVASHLATLPPPLGLASGPYPREPRVCCRQQRTGPDPP